jgi:hypothetical protein
MTDLRRARNERINEAKTVENGAAGLRLSFEVPGFGMAVIHQPQHAPAPAEEALDWAIDSA